MSKDININDLILKQEPPNNNDEPEWEDSIFIAIITKSKDKFKYCDVNIIDWPNRNIVHPSDIEDIEATIEEYKLKTGTWKLKVIVHYNKSPDTPNGPGEWESELEIIEIEQLKDIQNE